MTVNSQTPRTEYQGDGTTTPFVFLTPATDADDIVVFEGAPAVQRTDFTVALNVNQETTPGGTVTFAVAPANGVAGVIYRVEAITQETDYQPYDPFSAETHEAALDKLTRIAQQHDEELSRTLKTDVVAGPTDIKIPAADTGRYWKWDADGNVANGWSETDMDNRFAPIVHSHQISEVVGLRTELDSRILTVTSDANDANLQDQIDTLSTTKADDNAVVKLTGDQTIAGVKTFGVPPKCAVEPATTAELANKAYVDQVVATQPGSWKGNIDLSTGDSALPGTPENADLYYVGVGGTITASDGSGAAAPVAVPAGATIIWSAANTYWLWRPPAEASTTAASVTYDSSGNTFVLPTNVEGALDQTDALFVTVDAHITTTEAELADSLKKTGNQTATGVLTLTNTTRVTRLEQTTGDLLLGYADDTYGVVLGGGLYPTSLYSQSEGSAQVVADDGQGGYNVSPILTAANIADLAGPALVDFFMPVGTTIASPTDPGLRFTNTTWVEDAQGRTLVGAGTSTPDDNTNTKTFTEGQTGGQFDVELTAAQNGPHTHKMGTWTSHNETSDTAYKRDIENRNVTGDNTSSSGSGDPHENMQPYIAKRLWTRLT